MLCLSSIVMSSSVDAFKRKLDQYRVHYVLWRVVAFRATGHRAASGQNRPAVKFIPVSRAVSLGFQLLMGRPCAKVSLVTGLGSGLVLGSAFFIWRNNARGAVLVSTAAFAVFAACSNLICRQKNISETAPNFYRIEVILSVTERASTRKQRLPGRSENVVSKTSFLSSPFFLSDPLCL
nr:unnamed protein product [Spirometra erinaceieuropaei]